MAHTNVPSTVTIGFDPSRPRSKIFTETLRSGFARRLLLGSTRLKRKRFLPHVSSPGLAMICGAMGGVFDGGCQSGRLPGSGALWQAPVPPAAPAPVVATGVAFEQAMARLATRAATGTVRETWEGRRSIGD